MTLQTIGGSDYFGPVHWSETHDRGMTWPVPEAIPAFGRQAVRGSSGLSAGVCEVVPQFHPRTGTVLALGHVVFYRQEKFSVSEQLARYPVYAVRSADGRWSERRILEWDDLRGAFIYTKNCGQRVVLPLVGDGMGDPDGVALMGNFNITHVGPLESWGRSASGCLGTGARGFADGSNPLAEV